MQIPRISRSFFTSRFDRSRLSFGVAAPAPRLGGMTRPTDEVFGAVAVEAGPRPTGLRLGRGEGRHQDQSEDRGTEDRDRAGHRAKGSVPEGA